MGVFSFLNFGNTDTSLPNLYPIPIEETTFINIDVETIYTRILMDVLERTQNVPEDKMALLWNSCVKSASQEGMLTLLAQAMSEKKDLYLVYNKAVNLVRKADDKEEKQIKSDYESRNESNVGVFITFKKLSLTDMMRFYSALEYCSVGGLYKSQNLSHAIQIRVSQLRAAIGEGDSERAITDAKSIAEGLKGGKSVMLDKDDVIETAKPDLTATEAAMEFIEKKKSFYLGLPASWITGQLTAGTGLKIGDTGQADAKAIDRGLKPYFYSIIKPVVDSIFKVEVDFKSEDNNDLAVANETLKTFEITSSQFINDENKTKILNKLYALPEDAEGDGPPEVDPNAVDPVTGKPIVATKKPDNSQNSAIKPPFPAKT